MGEAEQPGPDESKFNNMEIAAAAAGPEAEARRNEMANWSKATGAYADKAAERHKKGEEFAASHGLTAEETKAGLVKENQRMRQGLNIGEDKGTSQPVYASPTQEGMHVKTQDERVDTVYRSPAELKRSQEQQADQDAA